MLSILFPRKSPSCDDDGQSVQFSVFLITIDCFFHIIKHLTTLDNKTSTELILEQCLETVHMLICETQWV